MSLAMFVLPTVASATVGDTLDLDGDEGHHAADVRRIAAGEHLQLTDGAGAVATCRVTDVGKGRLSAEVLEVVVHPPEMPRLVVVQALPKGDRGELAVEMLTEVGVDVIVPWNAERSQFRANPERVAKMLAKWRAWAFEASKQSRRTWFAEVAPLASTSDVARLLADAALPVVLHEEATVPLAALDLPTDGTIVLVIGPEGGLSPAELTTFATTPVRLGTTVLRTSTAGVAAASALLARSRWQ
jgi:16S rRNA (uracil1498-N3)-methyltransferase